MGPALKGMAPAFKGMAAAFLDPPESMNYPRRPTDALRQVMNELCAVVNRLPRPDEQHPEPLFRRSEHIQGLIECEKDLWQVNFTLPTYAAGRAGYRAVAESRSSFSPEGCAPLLRRFSSERRQLATISAIWRTSNGLRSTICTRSASSV